MPMWPRRLSSLFFRRAPKTVLFRRNYSGLTGGHLKLWDYFNHVAAHPRYRAEIYFTPQSRWGEDNPWDAQRDQCLPEWQPQQTDILFMEGMDWEIFSPDQAQALTIPVINLIQGFRHAMPGNPRYAFLKYKAIRICVSPEVTEAVRATGCANGPLFTNPNGLDLQPLPPPTPYADRPCDLLIVGAKEPKLAVQLQQALQKKPHLYPRVEILTKHLRPRARFLDYLNQAKTAVFLPTIEHHEGFYLPALEGMLLGTLVICPDCIGNRSFCLPGHNCFRPDYDPEAILAAVETASRLSEADRQTLLSQARQTAVQYTLARERQVFWDILKNLDQLW